jgi:phenylacetate-CoA ligase
VYNQYGSREVGVIACECPRQDGLHCFPWFNHVELLDENNNMINDGQGKVVVTTLENYSMPLIRFEIGDVAVAGGNDCSCGRKTFKLQKVIGRTLGYFKRADGALLHSHFIVQMLFNRNWLKRFQIIQETPDRIVIRLELKGQIKPDKTELDEISSKIKMLMGDSCGIEYVFVNHIQRSPSGKYLYTICKVK